MLDEVDEVDELEVLVEVAELDEPVGMTTGVIDGILGVLHFPLI